jgi:hypothetical protein
MMKHLTIILFAALALWGCTQPADVELSRDGYETDLEVRSVVVPDTNVVLPEVDATGVLPEELMVLDGVMLINDITNDQSIDNIATTSYALVFLADSAVRDLAGRMIGFSGADLGPVSLNGQSMTRLPHRVILRRWLRPDTTLLRGYEYAADLVGQYSPGELYTWTFSSPGMGNRTESVLAPARVQVQSPPLIGQGVVDRTRDLELLWRGGQGTMSIIISAFDLSTGKKRPLIELRSRANSGRALLPATILQQLARLQKRFVFTFILANRREFRPGASNTGRILVQAASIVNRHVELR